MAPGTYPADRPNRWPRSDSSGNARSKHRGGVPRTPGQYRPPPLKGNPLSERVSGVLRDRPATNRLPTSSMRTIWSRRGSMAVVHLRSLLNAISQSGGCRREAPVLYLPVGARARRSSGPSAGSRRCCAFLATERALFVTGASLLADGGESRVVATAQSRSTLLSSTRDGATPWRCRAGSPPGRR
jgi:hypothetical protein